MDMPQRWNIDPEPNEIKAGGCGGVAFRQEWELPVTKDFLIAFFTDVFENHWQELRYGPLVPGAAYEIMCAAGPSRFSVSGGYLTIFFSKGGHFHLCVDGPEEPTEHLEPRRPSRAVIFRALTRERHPVTWGFEMWNGKGMSMIALFFPNPFLTDEDTNEPEPKWERLQTWRAISKKWLGREPEALDEQGRGFA